MVIALLALHDALEYFLLFWALRLGLRTHSFICSFVNSKISPIS